jgi:hypothetical protein
MLNEPTTESLLKAFREAHTQPPAPIQSTETPLNDALVQSILARYTPVERVGLLARRAGRIGDITLGDLLATRRARAVRP